MPNTFALPLLRPALALHFGWVVGWQIGAVRYLTLLQQSSAPRYRTPLLRLHAEKLKLRQNVERYKPERWLRPRLRVVKPS